MTERNLTRFEPESAAVLSPLAADDRYASMLACLVYVARTQGLFLSVNQLILDNQLSDDRISPQQLAFLGEKVGMRSRAIRLSIENLHDLRSACPAVIPLNSGAAMVLDRIIKSDDGLVSVVLMDPSGGADAQITLDIARLEASWTGDVILLKRVFSLSDDDQPFGIGYIAGLVLKERRIVRDVAIAAIFSSVLQLAPIVYYRVIIQDAVAVNGVNTFEVATVAILWVMTFLTVLTFLRQYLLSIISIRLDARMNEYIFNKLLRLPIDYFERTQVGEIAHAINEADRIRAFLVGPLANALFDTTLLVFFVPAMFIFSWLMTLIFIGIMSLVAIVIIFSMPGLKAAANRLVKAKIGRGSFLFQTLSGIRTVKSLALESRQLAKWDILTAAVARRNFEFLKTANTIEAMVFPLQQLATTGAFAAGAFQALYTHNLLYSAYLYFFVILAQKASSPLMQLAKLIQEFDEAREAVALVKSVVNRPPEETAGDHGIRRPLLGHVQFASLRFKYSGSQSYALDGVTFEVPVGTTLGVVGRSGSGKTTVTRLLQRLHSEYDGLIKVDGVDIREYDLPHLRRSLGVVLQENFLFSGTIRDNIVAAKPSASFDEVVSACRLAGAEEFIDRLPRGYDTWIYEGSPNMSGGQRQRLAIARALIVDPRILILDEATSALDPDSEAIVNENIRRIAEGRTMLVISHRLSSLVNSDAILVLEQGKVADHGPHAELLERCEIYRTLWNQQNRHMAGATRQIVRGPIRVS